jgi:putative membrane protein
MMTGFGLGFGGLAMMLFWIVMIVGAVWLVRGFFPNGHQPALSSRQAEPSADEILKQRYARGEITTEQYEQMRRDLKV